MTTEAKPEPTAEELRDDWRNRHEPTHVGEWAAQKVAEARALGRQEGEARSEELKMLLDAVAVALHPHWADTRGHTYLPEQLPGRIESLRKRNEDLGSDLAKSAERIAELEARHNTARREKSELEAALVSHGDGLRAARGRIAELETALAHASFDRVERELARIKGPRGPRPMCSIGSHDRHAAGVGKNCQGCADFAAGIAWAESGRAKPPGLSMSTPRFVRGPRPRMPGAELATGPDSEARIFYDVNTGLSRLGWINLIARWLGEVDDAWAAQPSAPAAPAGDGEPAESAYWRFDARRKGLAEWKGMPMSERDAFKAEYRSLEADRDDCRAKSRQFEAALEAATAALSQRRAAIEALELEAANLRGKIGALKYRAHEPQVMTEELLRTLLETHVEASGCYATLYGMRAVLRALGYVEPLADAWHRDAAVLAEPRTPIFRGATPHCECSEFTSGGVPCPAGKCPNVQPSPAAAGSAVSASGDTSQPKMPQPVAAGGPSFSPEPVNPWVRATDNHGRAALDGWNRCAAAYRPLLAERDKRIAELEAALLVPGYHAQQHPCDERCEPALPGTYSEGGDEPAPRGLYEIAVTTKVVPGAPLPVAPDKPETAESNCGFVTMAEFRELRSYVAKIEARVEELEGVQ